MFHFDKKPSGIKKFLYIPAVLLMLAMPLVSFVLFEYVNADLANITPLFFRMNLLFYYALYLLMFAVFSDTRISVPVSSAICFILSAAEYFTVSYSGHPITPQSAAQLGTLSSVISTYHFVPKANMIKCAVIILLLNIVLFAFPVRLSGKTHRFINLAACGLGAAALVCSFYFYFVPKHGFLINQWDSMIDYESKGFAYSFAISMNSEMVTKPDNYSEEEMKNIEARMAELHQEVSGTDSTGRSDSTADDASAQTPVNIILIMNESLSDLKVAGDFTTNKPYFPYIDSLTESGSIKRGSLYVPVFGSGTSNSEFEVLTGDTISMLPYNINAYGYYMYDGMGSLVKTLKDQGYRTLAMHPMPAADWNRDKAYASLGFDEFLDINNYYNPRMTLLRHFCSDRSDYEGVLEQIKSKKDPSEKLFVFNVTMQNHGGYGDGKVEGLEDIHLTGRLEGKYPETDLYLSLMKESDNAFKYLIDSLSEIDEPTMVVMFGDHQPSVEDEFYDDIAGEPASAASDAERLKWYQTPVIFWTNYEDEASEAAASDDDKSAESESTEGTRNTQLGAVSTSALSGLLLKEAGLELTPYQQYLLDLRDYLPVIQRIGIYDKEGSFVSWSEAVEESFPYAQFIKDYECLVYDHLKGKTSSVFTLK